MAEVSVDFEVDVNIELTEEEKETLMKAHDILRTITGFLWDEGVDETETFGNVSTAKDGLYCFLKRDCGMDVDGVR